MICSEEETQGGYDHHDENRNPQNIGGISTLEYLDYVAQCDVGDAKHEESGDGVDGACQNSLTAWRKDVVNGGHGDMSTLFSGVTETPERNNDEKQTADLFGKAPAGTEQLS